MSRCRTAKVSRKPRSLKHDAELRRMDGPKFAYYFGGGVHLRIHLYQENTQGPIVISFLIFGQKTKSHAYNR